MVCRNICEKIYSKMIVGQSHYLAGKKYCRRCERYLVTNRVFCPCCGMQLRTTPIESAYKQKLRKEKRKLYYNPISKNDMAKATCLIDIEDCPLLIDSSSYQGRRQWLLKLIYKGEISFLLANSIQFKFLFQDK